MASRDLAALGYRRIVLLLVSLIVVPTALMLTLGVVLLFLQEIELNLLMGILVLALSGAATTGVILVWVFVRREANVSRLQSDFVSKVSHELRTPLTSIRLFTETLALRGSDPVAQKQCIAALERESMRLQELIDRLLDWGRMESGRREFHRVDTPLVRIIDEAVGAFETVRHRERVELSVDPPPTQVQVCADPGAVSDALLNLLTNAAKYGGDPCRVHVSCDATAKTLRIRVSDNGPGIPQTEHKRIFQKFYRVDDRLSREQEGSGLGLAIVKHVMKAHNGKVEIESRPGQGSTFSLLSSGAKGRYRGARSMSGPIRILIVEDDESIALGLKLNLEAEGYQVLLAHDGLSGLQGAREADARLVILDVMLPKMNGLEVLRQLRAEGNRVPVIMLSARGAESDKVIGLELGAEDYITKPFGLAELFARVKAVLRRAAPHAPTPAPPPLLRLPYSTGELTIDAATREVRRGEQPIVLTATEFDVLWCLVEADGQVLSREQIQARVWGREHHGTLRTIDNFLLQLRSKLETDPSSPRHLITVRGVGYRFAR